MPFLALTTRSTSSLYVLYAFNSNSSLLTFPPSVMSFPINIGILASVVLRRLSILSFALSKRDEAIKRSFFATVTISSAPRIPFSSPLK